jgi:hypothetical protein
MRRNIMQLRRVLHLTITFLAITCAGQFPALGLLVAYGAGTAQIQLIDAGGTVTQTGETAWTLEKSGSLSGNTVSWIITATPVATTSGILVFHGQMTVTNFGNGPATIGNIVVNLQKRSGKTWVTKSSDVADATNGDAATTANIHKAASSENKSSFTENGASGSLNFMDATNNTIFSLVPQPMIGAGQTRSLLFSAEFDNNNAALQLTTGTQIRAEIIVSFGNATANGNSTANVDINGNGALDGDEARVRSVPSRLTMTVPAPVNGNGSVSLTDTLADITSTGDVTFTNVNFNLGATSGTVTANVAGGTNGGAITNCAHLTGNDQTVNSGGFSFPIVDGVNLQACSTVNVSGSPPTCTPGAPGCGWSNGDMRTGGQGDWADSSSSVGASLGANFSTLYGGTGLIVGGTNTLTFTSAGAVYNFLPAIGTSAALNGSLTNPLSSSAGDFGGQVVALQLNADFSSIFGNAVSLTDLRICNFSAVPSLNGQTVGDFLATANWLLGGGGASFGPSTAASVASLINNAFAGGTPSTFAQSNLIAAPSCAN